MVSLYLTVPDVRKIRSRTRSGGSCAAILQTPPESVAERYRNAKFYLLKDICSVLGL